MRYKVITTCYWQNRYYSKGEIVELMDENVPEHFSPLMIVAEKLSEARKEPEPAEVPAEDKPVDDGKEEANSETASQPLEALNIFALQKLARENGLDLPKTAKKEEIIAALRGE